MKIMKWPQQKHCALSSRDTVQQYSSLVHPIVRLDLPSHIRKLISTSCHSAGTVDNHIA